MRKDTKTAPATKPHDPMLTAEQVDYLIDEHGAPHMDFWQEAGGGDRVPMPMSVALRIIGTL